MTPSLTNEKPFSKEGWLNFDFSLSDSGFLIWYLVYVLFYFWCRKPIISPNGKKNQEIIFQVYFELIWKLYKKKKGGSIYNSGNEI